MKLIEMLDGRIGKRLNGKVYERIDRTDGRFFGLSGKMGGSPYGSPCGSQGGSLGGRLDGRLGVSLGDRLGGRLGGRNATFWTSNVVSSMY